MSSLRSGPQPFRQPYHFALLVYPRQYRFEHGAEMVDAAQELSGKPWSIRESTSFMVGGLRTRGLIASQQGPRSVWAAGMRVALLLMFVLSLTPFAAYNLGATGGGILGNPHPWLRILSLAAVCIALTITTRWPTALLISATWLAQILSDLDEVHGVGLIILTVALAWWLALRTDGRRAMSPIVTIFIFISVVTVALAMNQPYGGPLGLAYLFGPVLAGLALITTDPRPLVTAVTGWVLHASWSVPLTLATVDPSDWKFIAVPTALTIIGIGLSRFSVKRVAGSVG